MKLIFKVILPTVIILHMFATPILARSGCCSHHGGVCGCGCCDGSALSNTCAPYYPECNRKPVYYVPPPTVVPTQIPTVAPTVIPTLTPKVQGVSTEKPQPIPTSTPQPLTAGAMSFLIILLGLPAWMIYKMIKKRI